MALKLDDLMKLMDKTEAVTLSCIGNPVGGDSIGNAIWEGVTLKNVLKLAGPKSGIKKVVFYGGEGYTDSIPFDLGVLQNSGFRLRNTAGMTTPANVKLLGVHRQSRWFTLINYGANLIRF
jgi:hypothetical protein